MSNAADAPGPMRASGPKAEALVKAKEVEMRTGIREDEEASSGVLGALRRNLWVIVPSVLTLGLFYWGYCKWNSKPSPVEDLRSTRQVPIRDLGDPINAGGTSYLQATQQQ